jgi:exopolysaccharide biosynthesis polyprenyl glycosylphosphotransferase
MGVGRPKLFFILSYEAIVFSVAFLSVNRAYTSIVGTEAKVLPATVLVLAALFVSYFLLMWRDLYSRNYHYYLKNTYRLVLRNTCLALLLALAVLAMLSWIGGYGLLPAIYLYLPVGALSFFFVHGSQFLWIRYLSYIGYFRRNCLIVGKSCAGFSPEEAFQDIGNTRSYIGQFYYERGRWHWCDHSGAKRQRVGSPKDIQSFILKKNIGDVIIVQGNGLRPAAVQELSEFCQSFAISYYLVPDPSVLTRQRGWNRIFPPIPPMERFVGIRDSLTNISLKRLLDLFVAVPALLLFLPLGLLIALAIKLEDGGPVFYVATRIGKNGRPIRFYKFRTMVVGADKQKAALLRFNQRGDGPLFKMHDDPRMTRVGKILRKHSFDEFPQMINVLLGDMSLVGPRPHLPEEVAQYRNGDYLRLECIPGIVCLPQIVGRNTIGFKEWVSLDLQYRRTWTLGLDLRIISRTAKLVLSSFVNRRASGG